MEGRGGSAPLWLLPVEPRELPPVGSGRRPRLSLLLSLLVLLASVPVFAFLAPPSRWSPESLLIALTILAFVSYTAAVQVRDTLTLDASFVPAVLAVVFLGPVPGTFVFAAPEVSAYMERRRLNAFVGDIASAAWGSLAAAWTLEGLTGSMPLPVDDITNIGAVATAGVVFIAVQYFVATLLIGVTEKGLDLGSLIDQELKDLAPVSAGLVLVGAVTAYLYEKFGLPGLLPLAVLVVAPRMLGPRLMQPRNPVELDVPVAIALYARGLAEALSLDGRQKDILADAATHLGGTKRLTRIEDFQKVMQTVLYCHERWDGEGGFPGILSGAAIPLESRVLAVAELLGTLTARGTRGLSPEQALSVVLPRAGGQFDPRVVAAARKVVEENILISPQTARGNASVAPGLRSDSVRG